MLVDYFFSWYFTHFPLRTKPWRLCWGPVSAAMARRQCSLLLSRIATGLEQQFRTFKTAPKKIDVTLAKVGPAGQACGFHRVAGRKWECPRCHALGPDSASPPLGTPPHPLAGRGGPGRGRDHCQGLRGLCQELPGSQAAGGAGAPGDLLAPTPATAGPGPGCRQRGAADQGAGVGLCGGQGRRVRRDPGLAGFPGLAGVPCEPPGACAPPETRRLASV